MRENLRQATSKQATHLQLVAEITLGPKAMGFTRIRAWMRWS